MVTLGLILSFMPVLAAGVALYLLGRLHGRTERVIEWRGLKKDMESDILFKQSLAKNSSRGADATKWCNGRGFIQSDEQVVW